MNRRAPPETGLEPSRLWALLFLASSLLVTAVPAWTAAPPADRTYFGVTLGGEQPYSWQSGCLVITESEFCITEGYCGAWHRTEPAGKQSAFAFELDYEMEGIPVRLEGTGRVDGRGKGDAASVVVQARIGETVTNFGVAGRSTSADNCERLVREWSREHPSHQPEQDPGCLELAEFGDPEASPYILPYPVGADYRMSQTYCFSGGGHRDKLAYDFALPIGADVTAARSGEVVEVRDDLPDDGAGEEDGENNSVAILHDDGTLTIYEHLQQDSVVVRVGDRVAAGQRIAASGNSGFTTGFPHLHFGLLLPDHSDLPVNFRNARGPFDERGGLIQNVFYEALPD